MFQEYGSPHAGVKVNNVLDVNRGSWLPLEGADDKVLAHFGYREVNITMEVSAWSTFYFHVPMNQSGLVIPVHGLADLRAR